MGILDLFRRAKDETPPREERASTLASPSTELVEALFAAPTSAGPFVTSDTALRNTAVYAAVRILAESIASLPLILYERTEDGGKARANSHALFDRLRWEPNRLQTSFTFWEQAVTNILLLGNAYTFVQRNGRGDVIGLHPLRADQTRVQVERVQGTDVLTYLCQGPTGEARFFQDDVFHIHFYSKDGIVGLSPIRLAREAVGTGLAMEEYAGRFFANDSTPRTFLEYQGELTPERRQSLREQWESLHKGSGNAHRTAVLEAGLTARTVSMNPKDSQFIESRKFQLEEIARIFRVPPHMLGDLDKATFCLPADSLVYTDSGPKRIVDVSPGSRVWSLDESGSRVLSNVKHNVCSGSDPILKITTGNRTLRANARHRVLVRRNGQNVYMPAGEIEVGDAVVTLQSLPGGTSSTAPNGRRLTSEFMEFCGLYVADGCESRGYRDRPYELVVSHGKEADYAESYAKIAERIFFCNVSRRDTQFRVNSLSAGEEMRELGFSGLAHEKTIPDWVFTLPIDLKLSFLAGFLDGDGTVAKNGQIQFCSVNRTLLEQVRHLLMSVGVSVTNVSTSQVQGGYSPEPHTLHRITCTCVEENRTIPTYTQIYRARLAQTRGLPSRVPYRWDVGKGFDLKGCSLSKIRSIEVEDAEPVYDLEVDNTHNFVADGVVVHNSNIEQQSIEFVMHTLRPWTRRIEQEIRKSLLLPSEREHFFAEFLVMDLLRGDTKSRYEAYRIGRQDGWLSANEIRAFENLNPIENGDAYFVSLNTAPVEQVLEGGDSEDRSSFTGALEQLSNQVQELKTSLELRNQEPVRETRQEEPSPQRPSVRQGLIQSHQEVFRRLAQTLLEDEIPVIRELVGGEDREGLVEGVQRFYEGRQKEAEEILRAPIQGFAEVVRGAAWAELGRHAGEVPDLEKFTNAVVEAAAVRWANCSQGSLLVVCEDPGEELDQRLAAWGEKRADEFAKDESVRIGNAVARATFVEAGITEFRWVCHDDNPFCRSLDGQVTNINQPFVKTGTVIDSEREDVEPFEARHNYNHAPLTQDCSCEIVPVRGDANHANTK